MLSLVAFALMLSLPGVGLVYVAFLSKRAENVFRCNKAIMVGDAYILVYFVSNAGELQLYFHFGFRQQVQFSPRYAYMRCTTKTRVWHFSPEF